ncbi:lasso peptide biosynthesis B2 protein [Kribbella deserti]|uniref:Lasso peptide biosynthesis B2 protein n=1 Tax=Kribbella deserti TaxID=1926257 RepID=A0ABV6QJ45_9ACTN
MTSVKMAIEPTTVTAPLHYRAMALPVLLVASLLARRSPLRITLGFAKAVKRVVSRRPATRARVELVLAARDWAAARFPGRSACMEASLAAFLLTALTGRSVDWCIGCRFQPAESHAWIETGLRPVGEPTTPDRPFHVTIRI